jgi:hypothetical protein
MDARNGFTAAVMVRNLRAATVDSVVVHLPEGAIEQLHGLEHVGDVAQLVHSVLTVWLALRNVIQRAA